MIFHIPHASTFIPAEYREKIALSNDDLDHELLLMTDHYTDDLFRLFTISGDLIVKADVSRLVVDVERFDDDEVEAMSNKGMGAIYTRTSSLEKLRDLPDAAEREKLLDTYYRPHHARLTQAVQSELDSDNFIAFVLDCHSFPSIALPYEDNQEAGRPDFCVGTDRFHTPYGLEEIVVDFLRAHGFSVNINAPFAGSIVPAAYYHSDEDVGSLMIEINRRLYMDERSGEKGKNYQPIKSLIGKLVQFIRFYIEGECNLSNVVEEYGTMLAWQEWDSGSPGSGAGKVELYDLHGTFYSFHDAGYSEYDSLPEALSESDALKQTPATIHIRLSDELFNRSLMVSEVDFYRRRLSRKVEEWLGFDIPSEGSEDYDRWMSMTLDIEDIKTLGDIEYWIECHSSGEFIDFLVTG